TDGIASATVQEQSGGQTFWTPPLDRPSGTLYWRVRANDSANAETSSFSSVASFVVEPFDPHKAIFLNNPVDIGSWPETARITAVDFDGGEFVVDFDKRQGSPKWPESGLGTDGTIQYTLGMCLNVNS